MFFPMSFAASLTLRMLHCILSRICFGLSISKVSSMNCFFPWRSLSQKACGPCVSAVVSLELVLG